MKAQVMIEDVAAPPRWKKCELADVEKTPVGDKYDYQLTFNGKVRVRFAGVDAMMPRVYMFYKNEVKLIEDVAAIARGSGKSECTAAEIEKLIEDENVSNNTEN